VESEKAPPLFFFINPPLFSLLCIAPTTPISQQILWLLQWKRTVFLKKIVEKDVETKMSGGSSRLFAHPATGMFVFAFLLRFCRQAQESHQTLCVFVPGFN
jgi:hypothetical protein